MRVFTGLLAMFGCLLAGPALAQQAPPSPAVAPMPAPPPIDDQANLWLLDLSTGGRVTVWLRPDVAPKMVARVKTLTRQHFYDGLDFHRVIDGFMAQGGDPKGDGTGGSKLPDVPAEFNGLPHVRGAVAAARADDPDSANSQFYIMFQPRLSLDKKYTVFGRVIDGMQYVDAIQRGEPPADPTKILHAYIASDHPPAFVSLPPSALGMPVTLPGAPVAPQGAAVAAPSAGPKVLPASGNPRRR